MGDAEHDPGRGEAALDCQSCAACCRHAFESVTISPHEPLISLHPRLVRHRDGRFELTRMNDRCVALASEGQTSEGGERYACTIYDDRPRSCRDFARGGERCLEARRRVGLSP